MVVGWSVCVSPFLARPFANLDMIVGKWRAPNRVVGKPYISRYFIFTDFAIVFPAWSERLPSPYDLRWMGSPGSSPIPNRSPSFSMQLDKPTQDKLCDETNGASVRMGWFSEQFSEPICREPLGCDPG